MTRKRPRFLLDCDQVLGDFVTPTLSFINERLGTEYTINDIHDYNVFASLHAIHLEDAFDDMLDAGGWCKSIPVLPDAKEAVERLKTIGDVYVVTAPHHSKLWVSERFAWLHEHFNLSRSNVAPVKSKFIVDGDMLLDDHDHHLVHWHNERPDKLALLWNYPWNVQFDMSGIDRVFNWEDVFRLIDEHLCQRSKS